MVFGSAGSEGHKELQSFLRTEQLIHLCHHLERISDVHHIGFAPGPAAVRIERDGPAFADKPPTDYVRLLAVAACREPLLVTGRRAGLSDLVHMGEEGKY